MHIAIWVTRTTVRSFFTRVRVPLSTYLGTTNCKLEKLFYFYNNYIWILGCMTCMYLCTLSYFPIADSTSCVSQNSSLLLARLINIFWFDLQRWIRNLRCLCRVTKTFYRIFLQINRKLCKILSNTDSLYVYRSVYNDANVAFSLFLFIYSLWRLSF